jgi:hypothetical protein
MFTRNLPNFPAVININASSIFGTANAEEGQ